MIKLLDFKDDITGLLTKVLVSFTFKSVFLSLRSTRSNEALKDSLFLMLLLFIMKMVMVQPISINTNSSRGSCINFFQSQFKRMKYVICSHSPLLFTK